MEADDVPLAMVHHYFGEMIKHYHRDEDIQRKVKERLNFIFTKPVGIAYLLTPKYAAQGLYLEEDRTDFISFVTELAEKIDPATAETVAEELTLFITKMQALPEKREKTIFKMTAKTYWSLIGQADFPNLFKIIKPINEMICSSATSERAWSTFKFVHSRLRNRLTNERVKRLVFLYTNCAFLDVTDKNDYILEEGALLCGNDYEEGDMNI